jgi:hypothetical protein
LEEKQTSLIPMLMRLRHLDEPTLATKLQMQFPWQQDGAGAAETFRNRDALALAGSLG